MDRQRWNAGPALAAVARRWHRHERGGDLHRSADHRANVDLAEVVAASAGCSGDASTELLTVEEEAAVEEELLVLPNASNSVELVLSVEFVLSELLAPVEADSVPFELSMSVSEL